MKLCLGLLYIYCPQRGKIICKVREVFCVDYKGFRKYFQPMGLTGFPQGAGFLGLAVVVSHSWRDEAAP
jgi:hypothetical protein